MAVLDHQYELLQVLGDRELPHDHKIDIGIAVAVNTLRQGGIETYESCQGGEGHAFPGPTVRFHGDRSEGFRALAIALRAKLPVAELRRFWSVHDREPIGPHWEITFCPMGEHGQRLRT